MLEKIESLYLAVVRVIVLVAATLAMVAFVIGLSVSAPMLLEKSGLSTGGAQVKSGDLAEFIKDRRGESAELSEVQPAPSDDAKLATTPGIMKAAKLLDGYIDGRLEMIGDQSALESILMSKRDDIPLEYQARYEKSLTSLFDQLQQSKGTPLKPERLDELIDWHLERFKASAAADKIDRDANVAKALAGAGVAAASLLAFLLIIFFFVFVKIERNLRLVLTKEVDR